jgi:NADH-quinone oxidoreductase subunit G
VVAISMFENESTKHADVIFPAESHAEKEGTVTHPDGRLQRVRPSAARPGDVRPAWLVLTEIAEALGDSTGIASAGDALDAVAEEVPFYAGITPEEIGGRGIRWQERPAASAFPQAGGGAGAPSRKAQSSLEGTPTPFSASEGFRLGTYRDIWAGPVTELNPALAFLKPEQAVEMSVEDAEAAGVADGDRVEVSVGSDSVQAVVRIRGRMQGGVVFLIEGTAEGNANALLNGGGEPVEVRKVSAAELIQVAE